MNKVEKQLPMNDSAKPLPGGVDSAPDREFEAAKLMMPYQFGSLWWGRDDLIQKAQKAFVHRPDRVGHPLLSIRRGEIMSRQDMIPMLFGTSGTKLRNRIKNRCVQVKALTAEAPGKICFFGSIISPGLYGFEDLLDGMVRKAKSFKQVVKKDTDDAIHTFEPVHWFEIRTMAPNTEKPHVDDNERRALEKFCVLHNI